MFYPLRFAMVLCLSAPVFFIPTDAIALEQKTHTVRVVVLPFKNLSQNPKHQWLGDSFAESLTGALSQLQNLEVIERNQIQSVLKEHRFAQTALVEEKSAPQLGKMVGAQKMVLGSYQKLGDTILIQSRLVDVETGRVEQGYSVKVQGAFSQLFNLQEALSLKLLKVMNISYTHSEQAKISKALNPTGSTDAYQFYQEAIAMGREQLNLKKAIELLKKAIELDPEYALAYAELSETLSQSYIYRAIFTSSRPEDMEEALRYAQIAIRLAPHSSATYRALGSAYFAQNQKEKAIEYTIKAIKISPKDSQAILDYINYKYPHNHRSHKKIKSDLLSLGADLSSPVVRFQLAQSYGSELKRQSKTSPVPLENLNDLLETLKSLSLDMPQNPFVPMKVAEVYGLKKDFVSAEVWIDKGLKLSKGQFFSYFLAGAALMGSGTPQKSRFYLKKSFDLNPKFSFSALLLGITYLKTDEMTLAAKYFKHATEANPQSALAPMLWGEVLGEQGEYKGAEKYLKLAINNVGKDPSEDTDKGDILISLAHIYAEQKMWAKAEKHTQEALAQKPMPNEKHIAGMAWIYYKQEKYTQALNHLKKYMEMSPRYAQSARLKQEYQLGYLLKAQKDNPKSVDVLNDLVSVLLSRKRFKEAHVFLTEALRLEPNNLVSHYNLGLFHMYQSQWIKAQSQFEKTLKFNPKHQNAQYNLGYIYYKQGYKSKAKVVWKALLTQHPNHTEAKKALSF